MSGLASDSRLARVSSLLSQDQRAAALELAEEIAVDGAVDDLRALAKMLKEVGELATCARALERMASLETPDPAASAELAQTLWLAGRSDEAVATLRRCLNSHPHYYSLFNQMGMVHLSAGHSLDAFMAYASTLTVKPNDAIAQIGRACALRLLTGQKIVTVAKGDVQARFAISGQALTVDFVHLTGRFYEDEELEFLASVMSPGGIIVDVGANIGNHAVFFLRALAPRAMHLFEPSAACLAILRENLALNLSPDCQLYTNSEGVGAKPGELFLRPRDDLNNGLMSTGGPGARRVEIVTLDAKIPRVDLIKIDVEGMEIDVLQGAERLLRESRPLLFVEVWAANRRKFEDLLLFHGYRTLWSKAEADYANVIAGPQALS